jgi:hypothetical protein
MAYEKANGAFAATKPAPAARKLPPLERDERVLEVVDR